MNDIVTGKNLKMAALCAAAAYFAQSFTSTQGKLVQGASMVAAVAITLPFASKL